MTTHTLTTQNFTPLEPFNIELEGIHLIEASAGTGKTYTIATLFIRLLLEKQLRVDQILVVTFTEAATQELRYKIRERLLQTIYIFEQGHSQDELSAQLLTRYTHHPQAIEQLTTALRSFDAAAIFTIHSFCRQMLQDNAFESNTLFDTELVKEQMPFLETIVADFWRQYIYHYPTVFVHYLAEQGYEQPDDLLFILNKGHYIGQPLLTIIPNEQDIKHNQIDMLTQRFQQKLIKVRHLWSTAAVEVEQLLTSNPHLNRTKYNEKYINNYCHIINNFLKMPTFKQEDKIQTVLEKFTTNALANGVKKGGIPPYHPFFQEWTGLFVQYEELITCFKDALLNLKLKLLRFATESLEKQKLQYNIQFFNDLLTKLYFALQGKQGKFLAQYIRKRFPVALIDEFQDTDPVQYAIFRKIYYVEKHVLFLIGDPKQAIYSFRGADVFAYMTACEDAKQRHTLDMNWRSETELIQAINTLFTYQKNVNPFIFKEITFHSAQPSPQKEVLQILEGKLSHLQLWFITRQQANYEENKAIAKDWAFRHIPEMIASEIKKLLFLAEAGKLFIGKRAVIAGDIAILVRKHQQAHLIQQALLKSQISSVLYSDNNLFETHELVEIERILLACAEPSNENLLKAALTTDMIGMTANELYHLVEEDDFQWQRRIKAFSRYHYLWQHIGFIQMFRTLLTEEQVTKRLLNYPDGERRLTNVLHAAELLQQATKQHKLNMTALCHWLAQKRHFTDILEEEHQLRLESDEKRVKIYTIHKSKGLEFNIVFCPFLWDGHLSTKPDYFTFHDGKNLVLDVGSSQQIQHFEKAKQEELAENMRLCYVALTRAKHRCYVVWGAFKEAEHSALARLLHTSFNKEMSDAQLLNELKNLENNSNNAIKINEILTETYYFTSNKAEQPILREKIFTGKIIKSWKVTSFSALSSTQTDFIDKPDHDAKSRNYPSINVTSETQPSIFTFPRGAKAGQFIHELFERLDFTQYINKEQVEEKLRQFNYAPTQWLPVIMQLIKNVITTPLSLQQVTLSQISLSARLNELEFFYPLKHISVQGLHNIFADFSDSRIANQLAQWLNSMNFAPLQGMMKGYIDMIFEHQNKFYIVDYKSNFLGISPENYHVQQLMPVMSQELYLLQYHIYAVALHRYLSVHLKNYLYSQHFGGIYYLFVRGMQPTLGNNYGIYYDLPKMELIHKLSDYFNT